MAKKKKVVDARMKVGLWICWSEVAGNFRAFKVGTESDVRHHALTLANIGFEARHVAIQEGRVPEDRKKYCVAPVDEQYAEHVKLTSVWAPLGEGS